MPWTPDPIRIYQHLCLPKSPFLLRQLMLRSTMDTLEVPVATPARKAGLHAQPQA
jgi:hypothetical protein